MKKLSLITVTVFLFFFSLWLASISGPAPILNSGAETSISLSVSPLIYTGFKAEVARLFAVVFGALLTVSGRSILFAIIVLALLVELILLYPAVRLQIKQRKIHLLHKKLIDRFKSGELTVSKTENEMEKLYEVNERIHHRGAFLVAIQIALFFFTFWGLNLILHTPQMLYRSWSALNFTLLSRPEDYWVPLSAGALYFVHAMIKMSYKQKEDYISPAQSLAGFIFAIILSALVYIFASAFSVALTIYFVSLITFATLRFIAVEQNAAALSRLAQQELITMLRGARPQEDRFIVISRAWNHLPGIRHLNFNLLEEALSMTLGLLLALSFFGAFQKPDFEFNENLLKATVMETGK